MKGIFVRMVDRWDYISKTYQKYMIPAEWKVATYSEDMEEKVNCCQCGKEIKFGDSYSSQEIQTQMGFGYATCEKCHEEEMERCLKNE